MAMGDKATYTVINHLGAAKEGTGNGEFQHEGGHDEAQARLQTTGEKVKYASADTRENVQGTAGKLKQGFSTD